MKVIVPDSSFLLCDISCVCTVRPCMMQHPGVLGEETDGETPQKLENMGAII